MKVRVGNTVRVQTHFHYYQTGIIEKVTEEGTRFLVRVKEGGMEYVTVDSTQVFVRIIEGMDKGTLYLVGVGSISDIE